MGGSGPACEPIAWSTMPRAVSTCDCGAGAVSSDVSSDNGEPAGAIGGKEEEAPKSLGNPELGLGLEPPAGAKVDAG